MPTIGAICFLAVVSFSFYCGLLNDRDLPPLADLELNDDDLDLIREIEESNRGKRHG
jgi:hypothetical protein